MTGNMLSNKRLNQIVSELFMRGRKLNIFLVFITQSYIVVPKNVKLNSSYYFIMKIPNRKELQNNQFNHLPDIDFKEFINLYKIYTGEKYIFLVIDATLASDNLLRFRKNHLDKIENWSCQFMIRLETKKNYNSILTENLEKYQH